MDTDAGDWRECLPSKALAHINELERQNKALQEESGAGNAKVPYFCPCYRCGRIEVFEGNVHSFVQLRSSKMPRTGYISWRLISKPPKRYSMHMASSVSVILI